MSKGGKTTSTSETKVDPQLMQMYYRNYNNADALANTPYQPYTGQRVAGFNDTQKQTKSFFEQIAGDQTGKSTLDSAKNTLQGILDYHAGRVNPAEVESGQLKGMDISGYLNPYTQNVVDTTMADMARARDIERVKDNQRQTVEDAFGGSRHGVADSLTNDAYLRGVGSTTAALRSAGYDKAMGWAGDDLTRKYAADTFNASNKLNADQFNVTSDMNAAGMRANAANSMANMSNQELEQAIRRALGLGAIGDAEQANSQAGLDANYQEHEKAQNWPLMMQQIRNGALTMMPLQQTQTNTTKTSGGGGILGALGPLVSAASMFVPGMQPLGILGALGGGAAAASNPLSFAGQSTFWG